MSDASGQPLGLLGGSFDPIHTGHLQLAADALAQLGLAEVRFVPAGQPWQKGAITPAADRVRMLALALRGQPRWQLDTREVERPGPSYTVDTLREFRQECGAQRSLVWLLGFDQLRKLDTWHRWEELIGLAHIAYARRAGSAGPLGPAMKRYVEQHRGTVADVHAKACGSVIEFAMQPVDCSATQIRRWLAAGDLAHAAPFLPEAVLGYLRAHHPYSVPHGN